MAEVMDRTYTELAQSYMTQALMVRLSFLIMLVVVFVIEIDCIGNGVGQKW